MTIHDHPATGLNRRNVLRGATAGLAIPTAMALASGPASPVAARSQDERSVDAVTNGRVQTMSGGFSPARLQRIHDVMAGHVASGQTPGLTMLVSRRGEIHADAIGTTVFDGDEPMRRDTI